MPGKQSTQESKCLPIIGSGTPASIQHLATFGGQARGFIREQINFSSTLSPGSKANCPLPLLTCSLLLVIQ